LGPAKPPIRAEKPADRKASQQQGAMSRRGDWYRRQTWSEADAAEFERQLRRSRTQRTQYLKLQAWHLAETRRPDVAEAAIGLANRYLSEDPGGFFEVEAHLIVARAKTTLRDIPLALEAYQTAVKLEAKKRGPRYCAYLEYAWFAATNDLSVVFDSVLSAMQSMEEADLVFPLAQYKYFGSLALISAAMQDWENARRMARDAIKAQGRAAPFARHKDVGTVTEVDPAVERRIRHLAA
jgi:hypothetical protein